MSIWRTCDFLKKTGAPKKTGKARPAGRRNQSHRARHPTVQWCEQNWPSFITKDKWPPPSPELNPMDYKMWSLLEKEACSKLDKNVGHLKRALMREWQKIPNIPVVVRAATGDFKRKLAATVLGLAVAISSSFLECCGGWSSERCAKFSCRYTYCVRRYWVFNV